MATVLVCLMWLISRAGSRNRQVLPALLVSDVQLPANMPVPNELTNGSSYTVVVSSPTGDKTSDWERRARAAEQEAAQAKAMLQKDVKGKLSGWLKQKFVRKLVSDRAQLLETQQDAAAQAMKVDERLARIENQIQQQTVSYERRIDELTLELAAAREENRELIRARIAQVKLEMETVRARMRAEAGEPSSHSKS